MKIILNSFLSGQFEKLSFSFKMSGFHIFSLEIRQRYERFRTLTLGDPVLKDRQIKS